MSKKKLPWVKEYKYYGLKKSFAPYQNAPVHDMLYNAGRKHKKMGIIQYDLKMTYPEVCDHVDRLATAFSDKLGTQKGDRVATILPTSIQFIISDFAISRAGLVHIPSSSLEPVDTLVYKFNQGKPKILICMKEFQETAEQLLKKTDIEHLIITEIEDYTMSPPQREGVKQGQALWLRELIMSTEPSPPDIDFNPDEDLETLLFTGGTTGLPKGCMLTHKNITANSIQNAHAFGPFGSMFKGLMSALLVLPLFHSYGHIVMHSMLYYGFDQVLIPDPRDVDLIVKMIKRWRPLAQLGVPTQFMMLAEHGLDGISLFGMSGSAPLPSNVQQEFEEKSSSGIMEGYGLSEMGPASHLNSTLMLRLFGGRAGAILFMTFLRIPGVSWIMNHFFKLFGGRFVGAALGRMLYLLIRITGKTVGHKSEIRGTAGCPYPDTEVKIIDIATSEEIGWDEMIKGRTGEMLLNGPQRMMGYWPTPGSGIDNDGYIHTGDVVRIDKRGYFFVVDRTKDMINVSGYKVYSMEVDDILLEHEKILNAATVGIPDTGREGSERVVVYIQAKQEYQGKLTEDEVITYLRKKVAKYAVPSFVKIVEEMPLTSVEKLDKKKIREMAEEEFA